MKKTKPVKGSARAKKFDAGGLAALAGLGALAYMMRKKKGESEGSAPKDKSGYSSGPVDVGRMIEGRGDEEPSAEVKRAMATSQGRPDLIPEGATDADRATMYGDTVAKRVMPTAKKPAAKPVAKKAATTSESSNTTPPTYYTPKAKSAEPTAKSEEAKKPKSKLSDTGKSTRLKALLGSVPGNPLGMKKGGAVKASKMGTVKQAKPSMGSASKRADGIAQRGKTRGRVL